MIAVQVKKDCPHVNSRNLFPLEKFKSLPFADLKCKNCEEKSELWICLFCGEAYCSRYINSHFVDHNNSNPEHCLCLGIVDLSVWCYECIDDKKVAKVLFDEAYKFAKEKNYKKIVGPVDASFWLKYRLKTNLFDKRPYTGEPYNKDYYLKLFTDNGYKIEERYTSQIFDTVDETYNNEKFTEHYNEFIEKGYVIVKPKIGDFDKCIEEIYHMITKLYSDFPVFKNIKEDTFKSIFNSYKSIINMDMVRMAYYEEKPVGFYISVPNYNNIVYHLNLSNILKIISIKKNPKEYVMLYMGVNPEHTGLGKAIAYSIAEELKKNKLPSIGALTRDGKITQNYAKEKINSRYEYVLLEREVDGY